MKRSEGRKSKRLSVRLEVEEWDFLQRQAEASRMVMSDFVRVRMGVGAAKENKKEYREENKRKYREKNKEEYREVAAQLAKLGNNVNQLAKWANTHKSEADAGRVIVFFSAALTELKKISSRVMGE